MSAEGRYLRIFAASLLAVLCLVGVINVTIDPYEVFGSRGLPGLNGAKPVASTRALLAKSYQLSRSQPRSVLVGSSRVDVGLDPASAGWPAPLRPAYNFGVPGSGTESHLNQLRAALARGGVGVALVMLDFENTLTAHAPPDRPGAGDARLDFIGGRRDWQAWSRRAEDVFLATMTMAALKDSVVTVLGQRAADPSDMRADGRSSEADFRREVAASGYHMLFRQKNAESAARNLRGARRALPAAESVDIVIELLGRMIDAAAASGTRLVLVVPPHHADALELFHLAGLWPKFEAWKKAVVAMAEARGRTAVEVWDFSGFDRYSTEPVPEAGDRRTVVRWFWEPGHFKSELGDLVLRRVAGDATVEFGVRLTSATLDAHLAALRAQRDAYRQAQPGARDRLLALHREAERARAP